MLVRIQEACKTLQLGKVSPASWARLREAECALTFDLQVETEHLTAAKLQELTQSLQLVRSPEAGAELWEWLAQPAGGAGAAEAIFPRLRALLALLGQASGGAGDLVGAAGAAYLALLSVEGSDRQWSAIFQPAILRQLLIALRGLRRGELRQKRDRREAAEGGEEADAATLDAAGEAPEADEESGRMPQKDAVELLSRLTSFLLGRGLGSSSEAVTLVIDELAALVLRPLEDSIGRQAASGLSALVARAGGPEEIRRLAAACIRATMPAMLMTQERLTSLPSSGGIPRQLQQARASALKFIGGLVRDHPELLTPQAAPVLITEEPAEAEAEPPRKKARKGKGRRGDDDESGVEGERDEDMAASKEDGAEAAEGGEGEKKAKDVAGDVVGVADGEKKGRRRQRPRGQGMDDPIVALLQLACVLTPDRSEWRNFAADAIANLLCEAADVERKLALASRSGGTVTKRLNGKTRDPALEPEVTDEPMLDPETQEASSSSSSGEVFPVALPIADEANTALVLDPIAQAGVQGAVERFLSFLDRILESERVSYRMLATEVVVTALERSGRLTRLGTPEARAELVTKILVSLVRRCGDAVPSVRGRALGGVATALQFLAKCGESAQLLRKVTLDATGPRQVDLAAMFRGAATDEKPMVRRASLTFFDTALPLLRSALGLEGEALISFFELNLMVGLSADESILVRKSSVSSLALLLRTCPMPRVCELWVRNVLPLVLDVEPSVVERSLDELEAAVLNPLIERSLPRREGRLPLPEVLSSLDSEAIEHLQRGIKQLSKRNGGALPAKFVTSLVRCVQECLQPLPLGDWPLAIWSMLEEVTSFDKSGKIVFELILDAWVLFSAPSARRQLVKGSGHGGLGGLNSGEQAGLLGTKILNVLEHLVPTASQERMPELLDSICGALASLIAPTSMIRSMMCLVERIEATWKAQKVHQERLKQQPAWRVQLLKGIQAVLSEYVQADVPKEPVSSRRLCASLFTLGELALLDPAIISDGVVTKVQTIATNTIFRNTHRVHTDQAVRGQAFASLGKFCLKKDALAKKSVELFVLHLSSNECSVVRNNVLIVLGDLCIHYTSLVDRFVPRMTELLRDPNELIRKQAAMILASLLSEDFIKFRGSILLRFLLLLSDSSESVRGFVECVFARILHQRNAAMFSQNFLDVVCALNGWAGLANFQGAKGNEDFSLQAFPARRAMIYRFMLTLMSNDQKFNVVAQIVTTLLAAFVDAEEKVELPATMSESGGQALSDGLELLSSKEMRVCFSAQKASQDDEGEADSGEKAGAEAAARGVLGSILKRNLIENIVPVLVQLKNLAETKRSPFLRQVRRCLRELLRDFKDDLKAMLPGDQQLAKEIAFDLEEEEGGVEAVEAGTAAAERPPALPIMNVPRPCTSMTSLPVAKALVAAA